MKFNSFIISLVVILCCGQQLYAQTRIGYFNSDSLLHLIPGYDTAFNMQVAKRTLIEEQLSGMQKMIDKKWHEYDSLKGKASPLMNALRLNEIQQITDNLEAYREVARDELIPDSLRLVPFHEELKMAVDVAVLKTKCSASRDRKDIDPKWNKDSVDLVNLNAEISATLKASITANAYPKKIGYVNRDSLLDFLPGYKENRAIAQSEIEKLEDTLVILQYKYQRMMLVSDSLASTETPMKHKEREAEIDTFETHATAYFKAETNAILQRDSIRNWENRKRLDDAILIARKKTNCFYVYDTMIVHQVWHSENAVLVSVNKEVAKEMGL